MMKQKLKIIQIFDKRFKVLRPPKSMFSDRLLMHSKCSHGLSYKGQISYCLKANESLKDTKVLWFC